ncbi:hypothetical protein [Barnesiella intestinihominis]|jgi:hypothetical protein|uniref:hypothetical protein n=1 Tax=Barnesiella intestinihominis TaxID=487174 RepID=UPI003FEFC406
MLRDSRIVHIIDLLGELRELLLVIDQAGDTAPAILLKLAKEKAEEITRLTRELRQPEFWDGILRYDPFTSVKTTTHEDAIPSMENPLEKVGEPVSSHITDENIIPTEKQSEESGEELDTDNNIADTEEYSASPIIENNEPTHENDTEENEEENDMLYPWEKLNGEELSAVQDENDDEYEDSNEFDEDMEEDYEEPDLYEEENTEEIIEEEEPATPVTLEEALQRQQAKELRKALSLNDRFRFRRELFGNSDIRMNETLSLIDAMQSYEEAEDYILNDLNWDVENPDVAEFMKIVQKHFL